MELDEALVRQQLAARGVPADSIPDEVLRQVLRDFKELDVGEDGAAPLSYPTALDDAEAVAGWTTAPPEPMVAAPAVAPMPAARAPPKKKRPPAAPTAAPAVDPYDDLLPPDEADAALAGLDLDFDAYGSYGTAARRPGAKSRARPASASGYMRPTASSVSLGLAGGSTSSLIRSSSHVGTPRKRGGADPVYLHARRENEWASNSFLANSPRRPLSKVTSPAPPDTSQASRRRGAALAKPPSYVVPTEKRRDAVIWETRERMRRIAAAGPPPRGGSAGRTRLVPNTYKPPTENRRDDLRWHVRAEMATRG